MGAVAKAIGFAGALAATVVTLKSLDGLLVSLDAKCCSNVRSKVAPRLSLLDTNTYLIPSATSASSMPLPSSEG